MNFKPRSPTSRPRRSTASRVGSTNIGPICGISESRPTSWTVASKRPVVERTRTSRRAAARPCRESFRHTRVLVPPPPTAGRHPRVGGPMLPDAERRPTPPLAEAEEGRCILVGSRRSLLSCIGARSCRRAGLVLGRTPRSLRSAHRTVRSLPLSRYSGPCATGRAPCVLGHAHRRARFKARSSGKGSLQVPRWNHPDRPDSLRRAGRVG